MNKIQNIFFNSTYNPNTNIYSEYFLKKFLLNEKIKLDASKQLLEENKLNLKNIENRFNEDILKLNSNLKDTIENLKQAIVAEKNMTGYIYSTNIPITKDYILPTSTVTIKNNIAYGLNYKEISNDYDVITYDKIISKTLNLNKSNHLNKNLENFSFALNEKITTIVLDLAEYSNNNLFFLLNLTKYSLIEILINNELVVTKQLIKEIQLPINKDKSIFTIRVHKLFETDTKVNFNYLGISKKIYTEKTTLETIPITINKELSYLSFDICDNSKENVLIDYYLKINDENYEKIETNKLKLHTIQNIITTNKTLLELQELSGEVVKEDNIRFNIPITYNKLLIDLYLKNLLNYNYGNLFVEFKEDTLIATNSLKENILSKIFVNSNEITEETFLAVKGIHVFTVTLNNNLDYFNYEYLKNISSNIYISKLTKSVYEIDNVKYISLTKNELKKSYNLLTENQFKVYFKDDVKNKVINTIQLKATLESKDNVTCPYISRVLIRGI